MPYIHNVEQGSEAWENIRKGKATASRFGDLVTARQLKLSTSSKKYAAELVAERFGIESPDFLPSYWMDRGVEFEEFALGEFAETVSPVERVGFVTPEKDSQFGCSPDGLVGPDATIQVKCPKPETLIEYHVNGTLPLDYRLQVQGELWITGRESCHFYAWHPEITPFHIVVERDSAVIDCLSSVMDQFLAMVDSWCKQITTRQPPPGFQFADVDDVLE